MAYPEEFRSKADKDGDCITLFERAIEHDLRFGTAQDLAWVKREDVPELIQWLQDYYEATEPPKPVLPTEPGSLVHVQAPYSDGFNLMRLERPHINEDDGSVEPWITSRGTFWTDEAVRNSGNYGTPDKPAITTIIFDAGAE